MIYVALPFIATRAPNMESCSRERSVVDRSTAKVSDGGIDSMNCSIVAIWNCDSLERFFKVYVIIKS